MIKKLIAITALGVMATSIGYAASANTPPHKTITVVPSIIKYEFIYNNSGQLLEFVTQDSSKNLFYYVCSNAASSNGNVEYSCDH